MDTLSQKSEGSQLEPLRKRDRNGCLKFLCDNWFMLSTVAGVCLGFGIAFSVRAANPSPLAIKWITMPSNLYIRLLQLTILPLIASNILIAVATLDPKKDGKIGIIGMTYIVLINLVSSIIGTGFALLIKPGERKLVISQNDTQPLPAQPGLSTSDIFYNILYNLFPDNIISITMFTFQTQFDNDTQKLVDNAYTPGTNLVGVLFCSIIFGAAAKAVEPISKPFLDFFTAFAAIVTKIMGKFLLITPVAVCFMVTQSLVKRVNLAQDFVQLGLFVATVLTGLAIHFCILLIVYLVASRRNPFRLLKYCGEAYILAFATTSPAFALPETYAALDKYGIRQSVSRLIGPLSAALKGDGPAIFVSASVIFIAQQAKVDLNIGQIFIIVFLTFSASLAVPNIPSASIVLVITILSSINCPAEGASLLYAMEWLLDRCRSGNGALGMVYIPATTQAIFDRTRNGFEESEEDVASTDEINEIVMPSDSRV